jgi:hypothetical protein
MEHRMIEIKIDGNPALEAALAARIGLTGAGPVPAPGPTPTPTPIPTPTPTPGPVVIPPETDFFPATAALAPFPSPEGSTMTWDPINRVVTGAPFLRDLEGKTYTIRPSDSAMFVGSWNDGNTWATQATIIQGQLWFMIQDLWHTRTPNGGSQTQFGGLGTPSPTPLPTAFPAQITDPSAENATSVWDFASSPRAVLALPQIIDPVGKSAWQIRPTDSALFVAGSNDGNTFADMIIVRARKPYFLTQGIWHERMANGGSATVFQLPAALGTNTPPVVPGTITDPVAVSPAPGSTGNIVPVTAGWAAAVAASQPGDTVQGAAQTYLESFLVDKPLVIDGNGAILNDAAPVTLVHGKAAIVLDTDAVIKNFEIEGVGLTEAGAGLTSGIRNETSGRFEIDSVHIHDCQDGIGWSSGTNSVLTLNNVTVERCGLQSAVGAHNLYLAGQGRFVVTNLTTVDPVLGHAFKSRMNGGEIHGGLFRAATGSCFDISDGSTTQITVDGATIVKPAGSPDHKAIAYCPESMVNGAAGMLFTNTHFDLLCDNPLINVGAGTVTVDATCTFTGTPPTNQGAGTLVWNAVQQ